jgi:hypothetical protein
MSSIYLPDQLKSKLLQAAKRRGYVVQRGRQSQLAEYLAYLISLDDQNGHTERPRQTLHQARGLLAVPGQLPPTDAEVDDLLFERRMRS